MWSKDFCVGCCHITFFGYGLVRASLNLLQSSICIVLSYSGMSQLVILHFQVSCFFSTTQTMRMMC